MKEESQKHVLFRSIQAFHNLKLFEEKTKKTNAKQKIREFVLKSMTTKIIPAITDKDGHMSKLCDTIRNVNNEDVMVEEWTIAKDPNVPLISSTELADTLSTVWKWDVIKQIWKERHKTLPGFNPYLEYYLNDIERICQENYIPTEEDMIRAPRDDVRTDEDVPPLTILYNPYRFFDLNSKNTILSFSDLPSWYSNWKKPTALFFVMSLGSYCEELGMKKYHAMVRRFRQQNGGKSLDFDREKDNSNNTEFDFHSNIMHLSIQLFGQMLHQWRKEKPKCIILLTNKKLLRNWVITQKVPFNRCCLESCKWGRDLNIENNPVVPDHETETKHDGMDTPRFNEEKYHRKVNHYINKIVHYIKLQFDHERKQRNFPRLSIFVEEGDCIDQKKIEKICLQIDQTLNV
ncbi:hypothetical protein RFI_19611 [Reticulomyxa filosa]|uniref:Uncharacterized protein n=1 Tax=Reticulomyxa filosa TaxID=46433 RepID=X6MX93_RETFI|nr:hypothetical protein RFI_19611 [Reticulomyxa filosa]|eukprot:ETO17705.1 hypothetical protein RFI_19611 [Reticulomyxa filosa]